jgi:hypothetical protein
VSIDAAAGLTLPTTAQLARGGVLELILSVDTQNARITTDGTTPTATNGILLTAGSGPLIIRGALTIAALKIIGVVAGGKINYNFTIDALQ